MKTNYTMHSIEEEKHSSFIVKFPSKERFTTKNNRYYTIVCETVKVG